MKTAAKERTDVLDSIKKYIEDGEKSFLIWAGFLFDGIIGLFEKN